MKMSFWTENYIVWNNQNMIKSNFLFSDFYGNGTKNMLI